MISSSNLNNHKLARAVFSTNTNEPQHGLILTAHGLRLAGVLFARVPLPDFNNLSHPAAAAAAMAAQQQQQQQRPPQQQQSNAGMTPNAPNSNVPMTLMGMSMANMNPNMMNNAAILQAIQRQQQQQQQSQPQQSQAQQQPSQQGMMNTAAMGSPVNAMNGKKSTYLDDKNEKLTLYSC